MQWRNLEWVGKILAYERQSEGGAKIAATIL